MCFLPRRARVRDRSVFHRGAPLISRYGGGTMSSRKFISAVLGLSLSFMGAAGTAAAQNGTITGTVTDRGSGQPVSGAQVAIEGTTRGTVTQENGRFTIPGVGAGTYAVTIRRVGYIP